MALPIIPDFRPPRSGGDLACASARGAHIRLPGRATPPQPTTASGLRNGQNRPYVAPGILAGHEPRRHCAPPLSLRRSRTNERNPPQNPNRGRNPCSMLAFEQDRSETNRRLPYKYRRRFAVATRWSTPYIIDDTSSCFGEICLNLIITPDPPMVGDVLAPIFATASDRGGRRDRCYIPHRNPRVVQGAVFPAARNSRTHR